MERSNLPYLFLISHLFFSLMRPPIRVQLVHQELQRADMSAGIKWDGSILMHEGTFDTLRHFKTVLAVRCIRCVRVPATGILALPMSPAGPPAHLPKSG